MTHCHPEATEVNDQALLVTVPSLVSFLHLALDYPVRDLVISNLCRVC
jgi:hypothetical protein